MNEDPHTENDGTPGDNASQDNPTAQTSNDEATLTQDPETLSSIADSDEHLFSSDEMTKTTKLFCPDHTAQHWKRTCETTTSLKYSTAQSDLTDSSDW